MKVEPLNFYELARASHIKRWHIVNTANRQSLAEHQYNVAVIGLELFRRVVSGSATAAFFSALLFHDSAEIRYGDIPTPGKAFIRNVLSQMDFDEKDLFGVMDHSIMTTLPYADGTIAPLEQAIIKMADLIEAAWWIRENGVGAHARIVSDKSWRAVEECTHSFGWYEAVNPILADLGMPHINRSERLTPP